MRVALAILLLLHGIAHTPGFVVPWRLATLADLPYRTTLLDGTVDVGPIGVRAVGLFWLLVGLAFVAASIATFRDSAGWRALAAGVSCASLVLSILDWPAARVGV